MGGWEGGREEGWREEESGCIRRGRGGGREGGGGRGSMLLPFDDVAQRMLIIS